MCPTMSLAVGLTVSPASSARSSKEAALDMRRPDSQTYTIGTLEQPGRALGRKAGPRASQKISPPHIAHLGCRATLADPALATAPG